jgi:hypothetical protein
VQQLLQSKRWKLPTHQRPSPGALAAAGKQRAATSDVAPGQLLQPAASNASDISVRYSLAEYYLSVLTPLTDSLLIGAQDALLTTSLLRTHSVTHVLILCCGPEVGHPMCCLYLDQQWIP